jgi:hypothetical protein
MNEPHYTEQGYAQDAFTHKYTYDEVSVACDVAAGLMRGDADEHEGAWDDIDGSRGIILLSIEAGRAFEAVYNARDDEPDWFGSMYEYSGQIREALENAGHVGDVWSSLIGVNMTVPSQRAARVTLRKMATTAIEGEVARRATPPAEPAETIFDVFQRAAETALTPEHKTFLDACDALDEELKKPEYAEALAWYQKLNDVAGNDPASRHIGTLSERAVLTTLHEDVNLWFAYAYEGESGSRTAHGIREILRG